MNIEGLLNINLSELRNFSLQANLIENEQNKRVVEKSKTILRRIENTHMQTGCQIDVPQRSIDEVVTKIKRLANGASVELTSREIRILTYNLDCLAENDITFKRALEVIEKNWRNIYFNGLVYFLMNSWCELEEMQFTMTSTLLIRQLKTYTESNKRYLLFKNHINLFEKNGPVRMCALIKAKNIKLEDAPTLLCLNRSSFSQSYYDDVIVSYFTLDNCGNLGYIEEVLSKHNSTKTKKLVFANLIIDANINSGDLRQVEIGNASRRLLGDISLPATWAPFYGATEAEVSKLRQAYEIVKFWYAKQVIQTFFDVCVQDPERKSFWLKYIKEISDFRIVGSSSIKSSLNSDPRVRQQLPRIFVETNSIKNKTAALVMYIRDKVFVEFSDTGSVYIYPPSHNAVRLVRTRKYIDNINDLKDTSIGKAVDQEYYYAIYHDFGYLRHAGAWQERLGSWMMRKITSRPYVAPASLDDVFAVPTKLGAPRKRHVSVADTKNGATSMLSSRYEPVQKSLFDFNNEPKQKANVKEHQNSNKITILFKSKHIFDGQFQIGMANDGLYICKVSNGHIRKLHSCKVDSSIMGQVWIKKSRTDGYMPIVFNQNNQQKSMGSIKMKGNLIFYYDEYSSVKRINVSEI